MEWLIETCKKLGIVLNFNKKGGSKGWTPIHVASYQGNVDAVQALLNADKKKHASVDVFKRSLT